MHLYSYVCTYFDFIYYIHRVAACSDPDGKSHIVLPAILCELCNVTFETRADLEAHDGLLHTHPHHCDVCYKGFHNRYHMLAHHQSHFNMRLQCPQCPSIFKTHITLEGHIRRHMATTDPFNYPCKVCSKIFISREKLFKHRKNHHLKCKFCPIILDNQQEYIHHIEINHQSSSAITKYMCSVCKKCFSQQNILHAHKKQSHKPKRVRVKGKIYYCHFCSETFRWKYRLELHIVQHLVNIIGTLNVNASTCKINLSCILCYKSYLNQEEFKQHNAQVHPDISLCDICTKQISNQKLLEKHKKLVHRAALIDCEICQRTFETDFELALHLANFEHMSQNYNCKFCSEKFNTDSKLDAHKKSFHKNELKFECSRCEERFETKKSITSHMLRIHVKPHLCQHCGLSFHSESLLNKHTLKRCVKVKPRIFKCTICFQDYAHSAELKRHYIYMHLCPFSFMCKICGKRFNLNYSLGVHERTCHTQQ
jgi:KRAB domain-containing zinc finger protein